MESKIKSQQFGVGDLFSEGWQLYQANFTSILPVILCVYVPINIIIPLLPVEWRLIGDGTSGLQLSIRISQFVEFFMSIIATMGIAAIVEKALHGETFAWNDALGYGLSKWLTAIGTGLLGVLIIMGFTLLFIIPGFIWAFYYSFWIYAVALRDMGGKTALDYSKSLVQGQWWRVFGICLVIGLVSQIAAMVITFPLNLIATNLLANIITNTITDIGGAFFGVVTVVFFLNNDYRMKYE